MNNINAIINFILQGQDTNQLIQQMIQQNPQAQTLLNQMKQSNMSPKEFTLQYAKQNNININPILDLFNKKGIKL